MLYVLRKALAGLFIFLFCGEVFAWGTTGHRVIAEIAENHLTARSRRHLKKMIGDQKLAYWANWPDFIKSDTTGVWKHADVWHYVNVTPQQEIESFTTALKQQPGPNLYTQIKNASEIIKNPQTAQPQREIYLRFLIHLVGDLSQPMHTGRAEDLGGNKIQLQFFREPTNLHSLWDSKLIEYQKYSYTEYAGVLDILSKKEVEGIQSGTLEDWFFDSHKIANRLYADIKFGENYSYDYIYKYNAILERQLLYGGLRLAKILNEVL